MGTSWAQIAQSPEYQSLPPDQQAAARAQYFNQVVAPQIGDPSQVSTARQQFETQAATDPGKINQVSQLYQQAVAAGNNIAASKFQQWLQSHNAHPSAPTAQTQAKVEDIKKTAAEANQPLGNVLTGTLETGAHLVSGTAGQIAGGLAGLGAIPVNLARGQSLPDSVANAGNVVNGVENALTYQPRTVTGGAITDTIQYPFQKLGQAADWAGNGVNRLTGSPALATAVSTSINALPMLAGMKGDFRAPAASDFASRVPDAVANARSVGIKLTPTQAQMPGSLLGRVGESLSSHAKLERNISRSNAAAVDAAAAREVGINGPVTAESLQAAKAPHNAVYDEVSKLGSIPTDATYRQALGGIENPGAASFPNAAPSAIDSLRAAHDVPVFDASDAVARVRALRNSSSQNIKAPYDPDRQSLGYAQRDIANALEGQIERHLQNAAAAPGTVDPALMQRFKNARQSLAKIHSVEDALKAGKGQAVSAANLGKQLGKGVPLSGNLRTIAESAQKFPRSLQDLDKIRNAGPLSMLPTFGGGLVTIAHPAAWPAALGAVLTPPVLRSLLGSEAYQRAAFDPRVPQTYARNGLLGLGGSTALSGLDQRQQLMLAPVQ